MNPSWRGYAIVTGNYWAFTLSDGALRMLVLLHFYQQGFSPLALASLFLWYEFFGVVTNLVGGWVGARLGLNRTMQWGLLGQVLALGMLLAPTHLLVPGYVMLSQALSGMAKDLNKMSAKSSLKLLVPDTAEGQLYRWVSWLTGSKNAMKGVGFFVGGALLTGFGFQGAIAFMAGVLLLIWLMSFLALPPDLGKASFKPKFRQLFAKSKQINQLAAARLCLFAARDVWFVIALPVTLAEQFGWQHTNIGGFLACWVIGYGLVQSLAPSLTGRSAAAVPKPIHALGWVLLLTAIPFLMALFDPQTNQLWVLLAGLAVFGVVFAVNSSVHSYLIVHYAARDGVSLDVGFYYMANAIGRLAGTLLSGWVFQHAGFSSCLIVSSILLAMAALATNLLLRTEQPHG